MTRHSSGVERRADNSEVVGAKPTVATNKFSEIDSYFTETIPDRMEMRPTEGL